MRIRQTATAKAEAEEILRNISSDNPAAAVSVGVAIKAALARLRSFPHIGSKTAEPSVFVTIARPYRYLIFYQIDGDTLIIMNIRHPARRRPPAG